ILERLSSNNYLHPDSVEVNVQPIGRVTLSGTVETESEVLRVSEIIGALPGVREVENKIAARQPVR
ncbi:MAG: BON domain-containing protein, partial [Methylophilaceae bacterium]